jgi:methionine-rich copper-binding protein CopC
MSFHDEGVLVRFSRMLALVASLGVVTAVVVPGAARAHSDLQSIDPPDGSALSAAPAQVVLTFTADVLGDFTQVVTTCDGVALDLPSPVSSGHTVTQPLGPAATGRCTVTFRIVSADSHPIAGQSTFTVTPSSASPGASPSASAPTPSATPTASPAASSPIATPGPDATPGPGPSADPGPSPTLWWVIAGALLLALAALGVYAARRRG